MMIELWLFIKDIAEELFVRQWPVLMVALLMLYLLIKTFCFPEKVPIGVYKPPRKPQRAKDIMGVTAPIAVPGRLPPR